MTTALPSHEPQPHQVGSAALIITHTIHAGFASEYEAWLKEILEAVSVSPGYLGREIFRPAHGKRKYVSILRFDTEENLQAWVQSSARKGAVEQVGHLLEAGDVHEINTGIDFWFTPETVAPPKRWKQFLLTVSAVYPLSLLIPQLLSPLYRALPVLDNVYLRSLLTAMCLTGALTFIVMPPYTRLMKHWLFED